MKKLFCLIIFAFTIQISIGQNLVPNGDFEQYSSCPTGFTQFSLVSDWMNPSVHAHASPDYYHQCSANTIAGVPINWSGSNYQPARSGDAYVGIFLYLITTPETREYIEIPLTSPLLADSCYRFRMYLNLVSVCRYTSDDIGVYFSNTPITGITHYNPLPFSPQIINTAGNYPDTLTWTLVEGIYTATGGESHLIIGNYIDDANTTLVTANSGSNYNNAYIFIDDVSLTQLPACATGIDEYEVVKVECFPNPFTNTLTFKTNNHIESELILYDIASRKIIRQQFINSVSLNTEHLEKGLYTYELISKNLVIGKGKAVKF